MLVRLTTDHCVSTTARIVVSDATATFERTKPDGDLYTAEQMHRTARASLHRAVAPERRMDEVRAETDSPRRARSSSRSTTGSLDAL